MTMVIVGGLLLPFTLVAANTNTATNNNQTSNNQNANLLAPNANTQAPSDREVEIPDFKNPTGLQYLSGLLARAIQIILSIIGVVAVVVIVIAGFRLVLQGESESARTSAKNSITWAILGLVFALLSMGIVSIIQRLIQP